MDRLAPPLKIRAHHLLCLLGFRGMGYSEEFVANMKKVAKATFFSGNTLMVVDHCDVICSVCPHGKGDECHKNEDSAQKVKRHDYEVVAKLAVPTGTKFTWQEARVLISQKVSPEDLVEICRDCEWLKFGYCADALKSYVRTSHRTSCPSDDNAHSRVYMTTIPQP